MHGHKSWIAFFIAIVSSVLIGVSCGGPLSGETSSPIKDNLTRSEDLVQEVTTKNHFNITIVADLTNRVDPGLYPKPLHDTLIINTIAGLFYPTIVKYKRRMHQKDLLRFRLVNSIQGVDAENNEISLERFTSQAERIQYINQTLRLDLNEFKSAIQKVYENQLASPPSGDMYQLFQKTIKPSITRNEESERGSGNTKIIEKHRNIIILLTDGYIEYGVFGQDKCKGMKCPFLTPRELETIRQKHNRSGLSIRETIKANEMGLTPFNAPTMKEYEVLVLECYDRSLSVAGSTTKFPTDFEIMKEVWSVWLAESGVKRSEIHSTANTRKEVEDIVKGFLFVQ